MKYLITTCILLVTLRMNAQFPDTDPQFTIRVQSEFNDTPNSTMSTNQQLQTIRPIWNWWNKNETNNCNRYETFQGDNNIEISGGSLKMWLSKRTTPISYSFTDDCTTPHVIENYNPPKTRERIYDAEWLITNGVGNPEKYEMNYGFYAMKFKVPTPARDANGNSLNRGITFAWWTYLDYQSVPGKDPLTWAEVDFIELSGLDQTYTHNYLYASEDISLLGLNEIDFRKILIDPAPFGVSGNPSLEEYADFREDEDPFHSPDEDGFHVMSCEVTPQKITWYMDGKYLQSTTGDWDVIPTLSNLPYWNMELVVASVPGQNADLDRTLVDNPDAFTVFPYTVEIDYIRYHRFICGAGLQGRRGLHCHSGTQEETPI